MSKIKSSIIKLEDISKNIDGYEYLIIPGDTFYEDAIQYSPFSGAELPGAFLWELGYMIADKLSESKQSRSLLEKWYQKWGRFPSQIDIADIPLELQSLVKNRNWYEARKSADQIKHNNGDFCGALAALIDSCYSYKELPKLACVPIQYCPFCGVKLPLEFDQENWWEKEFKTFKWYKDHKLGEWADNYVDDHDWTEDDYPPVDQN